MFKELKVEVGEKIDLFDPIVELPDLTSGEFCISIFSRNISKVMMVYKTMLYLELTSEDYWKLPEAASFLKKVTENSAAVSRREFVLDYISNNFSCFLLSWGKILRMIRS